jgi:hypothetical protein
MRRWGLGSACILVALTIGVEAWPTSYPPRPVLPLAQRIERADLIVVARDRFALDASQSGRGAPVIGLAVDRVLAGALDPTVESDSTGVRWIQVACLGTIPWPWRVTGWRGIYFLNRGAAGWFVPPDMAELPEPRFVHEVNAALDTLAYAPGPARGVGRAAVVRWLEHVREELPPDHSVQLMKIRVVPDRHGRWR